MRLFDFADQFYEIAADMGMKRCRHFRIFLQNAPEDCAAYADNLGFRFSDRTGETRGLCDQGHFADHGAGADGADRNPPFVLFVKQSDVARYDDIGTIGALPFTEKLAPGSENETFRTEGKQPQLFGRERLEQAYRTENANIVIKRHGSSIHLHRALSIMGQACIPAFCDQKRRIRRIFFYFLAQTIDVGFQRMRGHTRIITPHFLKEHIAADNLVAGTIEILDDCRFFLGKTDFAALLIEKQLLARLNV